MNRLAFFISCLTILSLSGISAGADEIKVKSAGGIEKIDAVGDGDALLYSLSGLNSILGGKIEWVEKGYSVRMILDTNRMTFTAGSPYINFNGTVYSLIYPARIIKGALYVPAKTFTPLLDQARAENINWDADSKTLRISPEWYNITDVAISPKKNGILVEIFVSDQMEYEIFQSEGNWLNINFAGGKVNQSKVTGAANRSYLADLNAFQFESSAQVSLQFHKPFKKFYHSYKTDPIRLQIAIEDESFNPDSSMTEANRIGPDEKIDAIVIDAGHGGTDFGAIGRDKKTREKDITLEIARELARIIREDKQFKVVMTRNKDVYVPLEDRAKIANDAHADLYVSIHCNASPRSVANGYEIFYLAAAKNDTARAVAQLENAPFLVDDPSLKENSGGDVAFILNDMIQTEFQAESADLAYMVDMEMRRKIEIKSRGVDGAGFVVLNRVYMPSVLVETAFISNPDEERMLRDDAFRTTLAQSIYDAIKRFKAKYERK